VNSLNQKAASGLIFFFAALALLLFLPAWSLKYWQAWLYLLVFAACTSAITLYLIKKDPALLQRRMAAGTTAEKTRTQKMIQFVAQFAFMATLVVPALDHRFGWSAVPVIAVVFADALVITGLFIVFLVFRENTFTSAIIEVSKEQKVISTGPYAIARHPMYSGALLMLLATPVALGSWWGLLAFIPMLAVICWRLLDEEEFLAEELEGYHEYCSKVHWRLLPGIF
jgi:protein-S-isoprenylcysteine O-methyltransferase Ste14